MERFELPVNNDTLLPERFYWECWYDNSPGSENYIYQIISSENESRVAEAGIRRQIDGRLFIDGFYVDPLFSDLRFFSILMHLILSTHGHEDLYLIAEPYKHSKHSKEELIVIYSHKGFELISESLMVRKAA